MLSISIKTIPLLSAGKSRASQQVKKEKNTKKVDQRIKESIRESINSIPKIKSNFHRAKTSRECSHMVFQYVNNLSSPKVKAETSGGEL